MPRSLSLVQHRYDWRRRSLQTPADAPVETGGALEALVGELTPYEWRTLHAITSQRSFQSDIIGQLPLELVAHIFTHLDTSSPYRLQLVSTLDYCATRHASTDAFAQVSTRWKHVLRSLDVLKPSLDSWYDGAVDLGNADYALCVRKAQSVHAFRRGIPSSSFSISLDLPIQASVVVANTLIWQPRPNVSQGARSLYLLNLDVWTLQTLSGAGRETISSFCASDQIVAFTTHSGVCYVSTLDGQERKTFRMPSHRFDTLTCRGRTVACAALFGDYMSIFVWDYDTQRGAIRSRSGAIPYIFSLLLTHSMNISSMHFLHLVKATNLNQVPTPPIHHSVTSQYQGYHRIWRRSVFQKLHSILLLQNNPCSYLLCLLRL